MKLKTPTLATALLLLAGTASASELGRLARTLGEEARMAGLKRVAVVGFRADAGARDGRGAELADRLVTDLVRDGRVQPVERGLVAELARELSLDRTGAVQGGLSRRLRLAPVDGLIVGRYDSDGGKLRVYVRVVDARSGVIVGAGRAEVADDRADDPFFVPVPKLAGDFPPLDADSADGGSASADAVPAAPADGYGLRDAPAGRLSSLPGLDDAAGAPQTECTGAAARVNRLQEDVLNLKARYWALRLRLGLDGADVTVNPSTTIPDADLRRRFIAEVGAWHAAPSIPPLTRGDLARLSSAEGRSYELVRDCGL
ncbi:MAG: hypothetical protein KGM24_04265 [Elusimicrobia bacterium]|nr:hypothetical protein [Elusimicrobiota bacterium]